MLKFPEGARPAFVPEVFRQEVEYYLITGRELVEGRDEEVSIDAIHDFRQDLNSYFFVFDVFISNILLHCFLLVNKLHYGFSEDI